jgi:hypothetical protein
VQSLSNYIVPTSAYGIATCYVQNKDALGSAYKDIVNEVESDLVGPK